MSDPASATSRSSIIPMVEWVVWLNWTLSCSGEMANVVYMMMKFGREIEVTVQNGSRNDGLRILQWLEIVHVHHRRKLAVVKTLLADNALVDERRLDAEVALTLKMKEIFHDLAGRGDDETCPKT